jgi:hypothetical protein
MTATYGTLALFTLVSYPALKLLGFALALSPVVRSEQYGRLTAARRMFSAAIVSAWPANPHWTQEKRL